MVHAEHLFVWWWVRLRVPMDVVGTQIDEAGRAHGPSMLVVVRSSRLLWGLPNCDGTMALTLQGIKGSTTSDVSKEMSESFPEVLQQKSVLSKLPWPNSILQPSWGFPKSRKGSMVVTEAVVDSCCWDHSVLMLSLSVQLAEIFSVDAEATRQLAGAKERTQGTVVATTFNYKQTVKLQNILGILFLIWCVLDASVWMCFAEEWV